VECWKSPCVLEWSLYSLKVGLWCGVPQQATIGPIFCRETVTALCNQKLLVIMTFITLLQLEEQDYWFQQDGATAHIPNSTIHMLH
jgi:hypothetical protein